MCRFLGGWFCHFTWLTICLLDHLAQIIPVFQHFNLVCLFECKWSWASFFTLLIESHYFDTVSYYSQRSSICDVRPVLKRMFIATQSHSAEVRMIPTFSNINTIQLFIKIMYATTQVTYHHYQIQVTWWLDLHMYAPENDGSWWSVVACVVEMY